jgi:hypothetical protein
MFALLRRLVRRPGVRYYGDCPICLHDWREHPGGDFATTVGQTCGECEYEVEHDQRETTDPPCRLPAKPPPP